MVTINGSKVHYILFIPCISTAKKTASATIPYTCLNHAICNITKHQIPKNINKNILHQ